MELNKLVDFPTAKLLKEKDFNEPCIYFWFEKSNISEPSRKQFQIPFNWNRFESGMRMSAPFIPDVVDWLLEKYGIWISVSCPDNLIHNDWISYVYKVGQFECLYASHVVNTPKEAYLFAIEYTLKNLI